MRIDHFAYQRATKVAGFGLLVQAFIGLVLLIFGLLYHDTAFQYASMYVLTGVLVWLGLVIIFHQHKLERLEALEEDELAATRGGRTGSTSVFEQEREESRVAARRLAMMHKWFMPGLSLFIVAVLAIIATVLIQHMKSVNSGASEFGVTEERGWAVAICVAFAAVSFIFSRFVAGMAKHQAWSNLRGGAAYMVGNALLMVAVATGIIFRFFENTSVLEGVAWAIPIFMIALAIEIVLNFILNLYRPRIPGEVPRPAFDSKVLSLFAAPDNIVRSLNEAVNYQFGFDVTSSWGYQLLLRSFASLVALGLLALVLLSTMVVVEPHQQALRLRGGAVVEDANGNNRVYGSGVMWKWPWPIESAAIYDVARLRNLWLTAKVLRAPEVSMWTGDVPRTDTEIQPFLVASPAVQRVRSLGGVLPGVVPAPVLPTTAPSATAPTAPLLGTVKPGQPPAALSATGEQPSAEDLAAEVVSALYSLIDAEMVLQYRIKPDNGGLLDYLQFGSDERERLQQLTERERALKNIALGVVSSELSQRPIDDVLAPGRSDLSVDLAKRIQQAFDQHRTGVEVVALEIPLLRPSGAAAEKFEELGIGVQNAQEFVAKEDRILATTYSYWIGDQNLAKRVLDGIDEYNALLAAKSPDAVKKRQEVEKLLVRGKGQAAQVIADAERDRWVQLMGRRTQSSTVQSQLAAYRAAPELYRQRAIMQVYAQVLPGIDKIILGIDPTRVHIDIDMKKVNQILNFAGASKDELEHPK